MAVGNAVAGTLKVRNVERIAGTSVEAGLRFYTERPVVDGDVHALKNLATDYLTHADRNGSMGPSGVKQELFGVRAESEDVNMITVTVTSGSERLLAFFCENFPERVVQRD